MFDFNKPVSWINLHITVSIKPSVLKQNDTITFKVGQLDQFFEDFIIVTLCLCPLAALYTYTTVHCTLMKFILLHVKFKIIYITAIILIEVLYTLVVFNRNHPVNYSTVYSTTVHDILPKDSAYTNKK